jgi:hypothetical protein
MTAEEREVDIDGKGVVAFRADRRGEVPRFVAERGLRGRESRGPADVLVDEHGIRPADEVTYADAAAELDGARVGATPYPFDAENRLGRAGDEHQLDALSAQDGGQFRDLDVQADHDDATHAAERPEADAVLQELDFEGVFQVASFHPQFQFADTEPDDIGNFTNRSPYPTLHLLREESIDRAVEAFPEAEMIYETNIETMDKLGVEGWKKLDVGPSP